MYGIIYKATGPAGRVYVGQTVQGLATRKGEHIFRSKKGDRRSPFQTALLDEGAENFTWEQIDTAESREDLDEKEKQWIAHFNSINPVKGYNGTDGGSKTVYSPETRKKISEALKGKKKSLEHCRKVGEGNKGKIISPEHRSKISEANKGENHPMYGRHHTEEAKQKMSKAKKALQVGERNPAAKLTETIVRQIKFELAVGKKCAPLGRKYNVSAAAISKIKSGINWAWIQTTA
jgi:group I intron endonuclease